MSSYCVKCKEKTPNVGAKRVETKNGRQAIKSKCSVCGTTKYQFTGKTKGGNVPNFAVQAAGQALLQNAQDKQLQVLEDRLAAKQNQQAFDDKLRAVANKINGSGLKRKKGGSFH